MKAFKKALVYEFEGSDDLTLIAHKYAEEVNTITASDDYQDILTQKHLEGVDFFLVGVFDDFKNEFYDLSSLKYVCIDWTSSSMFDLAFLKENNIEFSNVSGQATEGVAQLMFGMTLGLIRKIPEAMTYAKQGGESFAGFKGTEMASKTVAVRGLGSIGGRFAEMCDFFGSKIQYSALSDKDTPFIKKDDIEVTKNADIFAVTTPINEETRESINRELLDQLNEGAVILDPGLFETFVSTDLLSFLQDNPRVSFWSDVNQSKKWNAVKDEFLALTNVYVTPHTGFFTVENRPRALELTEKNIQKFVGSHELQL